VKNSLWDDTPIDISLDQAKKYTFPFASPFSTPTAQIARSLEYIDAILISYMRRRVSPTRHEIATPVVEGTYNHNEVYDNRCKSMGHDPSLGAR
jgi:hypothetical protein